MVLVLPLVLFDGAILHGSPPLMLHLGSHSQTSFSSSLILVVSPKPSYQQALILAHCSNATYTLPLVRVMLNLSRVLLAPKPGLRNVGPPVDGRVLNARSGDLKMSCFWA